MKKNVRLPKTMKLRFIMGKRLWYYGKKNYGTTAKKWYYGKKTNVFMGKTTTALSVWNQGDKIGVPENLSHTCL